MPLPQLPMVAWNPRVSWLVAESLQSLPLSVCMSTCPSCKDTSHWILGSPQCSMSSTNFMCKDAISKVGHLVKLQVDMNSGSMLFSSYRQLLPLSGQSSAQGSWTQGCLWKTEAGCPTPGCRGNGQEQMDTHELLPDLVPFFLLPCVSLAPDSTRVLARMRRPSPGSWSHGVRSTCSTSGGSSSRNTTSLSTKPLR